MHKKCSHSIEGGKNCEGMVREEGENMKREILIYIVLMKLIEYLINNSVLIILSGPILGILHHLLDNYLDKKQVCNTMQHVL